MTAKLESKKGRYIKIGNCLIIRFNRCNNRCIFCSVEDEITNGEEIPFNEARCLIASTPKDHEIDFYGGEPTLSPVFYDLLKYARNRGHLCSIETNGRIFCNNAFARDVAKLGAEKISVQTTIHSNIANIHDAITRVEGSFRETCEGINNVVSLGLPLVVNIVITTLNVEHLNDIVEFLVTMNVRRIKFAMLSWINENILHITPRVPAVRENLAIVLRGFLKEGVEIQLERFPFCIAPEYSNRFLLCDIIFGSHSDNVLPKLICHACILRAWCHGIDKGYYRLLGDEGLKRVDKVSRTIVGFVAENNFEDLKIRPYSINFISLRKLRYRDDAERILDYLMKESKKHFAVIIPVSDREIGA